MSKKLNEEQEKIMKRMEEDPKLKQLVILSKTLGDCFNQLLDVVYDQGNRISDLESIVEELIGEKR